MAAADAVDVMQVDSIQAIGDDLLSISVASTRHAQTLSQQLRGSGAWLEVVAGSESVVVQFDATKFEAEEAISKIAHMFDDGVSDVFCTEELIRIPVHYNGQDLAAVCEQLRMSQQDFVRLHTAREFRVGMLGFTPGFAYIDGPVEFSAVSRLMHPRQSVVAGSVGIAGGRTGIYALAGPGGWPIVGHTAFCLFDASTEQAFRLQPGMRVRFADAGPDS